jgi:hypothetical protein
MPLVENHRVPEIKAALAKAKLRVSQLQSGAMGVQQPSVGESVADFQARNPHAGRAHENQLQAASVACNRLESELVQAMLASGQWSPGEIIARMSA